MVSDPREETAERVDPMTYTQDMFVQIMENQREMISRMDIMLQNTGAVTLP